VVVANASRPETPPNIRSKVLARRGDLESLLNGFTRLRAVSYVASPDSLLTLLDKTGLESIDIVLGDAHLAAAYRETLARKETEVTDRLLHLTESGRLQIRVPSKTIHSKLYIQTKPGLSRLIQTSANLAEPARAGAQVNYAWYFDVTCDNPFAVNVLKDYMAHAQGTSLFLGDLMELVKANSPAERTEVIEAWLRGKALVDDEAVGAKLFQELSRQVLSRDTTKDEPILHVQLPREEQARKEAEKLLKPLGSVINRGEAAVNGLNFVKHATQVTGLPMMQIDYAKQTVKMALNGTIQTLSKTLPDPETVAAGLKHIESYIGTVDSGETNDALFGKTAMYEALLYFLWSPFASGYMDTRRKTYGLIDSRGPRFLYLFGLAQNGKTTFLRYCLKLLTGQVIDPPRESAFTKTKVRASSDIGSAFPMVFDDLTPSKDIKKFEDIIKSFWEGWWQPGYVFPQLVISSNTENLPEWAKSRLKHIDFDVHFSPSEEARRTLNDIFSTPNDLFQWFAMFYLQELSRADEFSDDELSVARKCMLKLYEYAGLPVPAFFPQEPLEKLFDPGQRRWRDLLYRMQMARVRREKDRTYIEFPDAMQYREIQSYASYLPQTIKNRVRGKTLIIDSPQAFDAWAAPAEQPERKLLRMPTLPFRRKSA
jgi:hypothetical protein